MKILRCLPFMPQFVALSLSLGGASLAHAGGESLDSGEQRNSYQNAVGGAMPGAIRSVAVTDGGSGYTTDFDVTFTAAELSGSGASARAKVDASGVITRIVMTHGGSGYIGRPTVDLSAGSGSNATAVVTVDPAIVSNPETIPGFADSTGLRTAYAFQRRNGTAYGGFAIAGYGTLAPNKVDIDYPVNSTIPDNYPNNEQKNEAGELVASATMVLRSAIIGRPLAVFAISSSFGEIISPPERNGNGAVVTYRAKPAMWRVKTTVVYDNLTGEVVGDPTIEDASDSPEPDGKTTLPIENNERTIVTYGPNPDFYYSKHANAVYATQPGTITITWLQADGEAEEDDENTFTYSVASSPAVQERTLYWTDNGFNGPVVSVPEGSVQEFTFVYNNQVPKEVVRPYKTPWTEGQIDFSETVEVFKRYKTIYEDRGIIHGYNAEGRIFVEYLGNQVIGGAGKREQLGYEVINLVKDTGPQPRSVHLGEKLAHNALTDDDGAQVLLEPKVVVGLGLTGTPYIHRQADGGATGVTLYAIRETQPGVESSAKVQDNNALVYWLETSLAGLKWPKQYIGYIQAWPNDPAQYSIYARPDSTGEAGLAAAIATAVQLDATDNPALVYQDDLTTDSTAAQAQLSVAFKFYTKVTSDDPTNRALIRFTKDNDVWFERVFSQLDPYYTTPAELLALQQKTVVGSPDSNGDIATGYTNISGVTVTDPATGLPYDSNAYTVDPLTGVITLTDPDAGNFQIDFSADWLPFASQSATKEAIVGDRIEPTDIPADAYGDNTVYVGYIHRPSGTSFNVLAYKNPFVVGFEEAAKGAIIPINTLDADPLGRPQNQLEVWWYKKSEPQNTSKIKGTYWPSFVQKYDLAWPSGTKQIILASNAGSDDLPSLQATGEIYTQNDDEGAGYNPNEEHALMLNGRAWALRDDLNITTSSEPYVLIHYTEADQRPAMQVFSVLREIDDKNDGIKDPGDFLFSYPAVAGKILQAPMPLPLLPAPQLPNDIVIDSSTTLKAGTLASYEVEGVLETLVVPSADTVTGDSAFAHYRNFTWSDRKGTAWVYRGPHQTEAPQNPPPSFKMRYFYNTLPGFHFPGVTQPPVGTIVPYLREDTATYPQPTFGDPTGNDKPPSAWADQPLAITYTPQWPTSAPELRIGETLTLPKYGLPQIRGQQSAEFIYQESVAIGTGPMADRQKSARLFDPTRAKIYRFGGDASPASEKDHLRAIPSSVNTSNYLGKTYFPNLPPHLSSRLYFDPAVGGYGALVFKGVYMDEQVGEKYLQLNVMSAADLADAKALVPDSDDDKADWDLAIDGLETTMETFVEDPAKLGTYIPLRNEAVTPRNPIVINGVPYAIDPAAKPLAATAEVGTAHTDGSQRAPVGPRNPADVFYSDTAVDSYAVSASGGGSGFVVLAVGNGKNINSTDPGGPVSLQIFKISAPLYRGELKVVNSANPLDEKLTLQHTGDFAGRPEDYDFEWRYGPPIDGLPPKLYSFEHKDLIGGGASAQWTAVDMIHNPAANALDPAKDYSKYRNLDTPISDVVTAITVDEKGEGYTTAPSVAVIGGNGLAATAIAHLSSTFNSIKVTHGGTGYTDGEMPVIIDGGGGQGAAATATVENGVITQIIVDNPGTGYTSAPVITISGAGKDATAVAAFGVESVEVTSPGIGYTATPEITFDGDGSGTSATATIGSLPPIAPAALTINNGYGTGAHGNALPYALLRKTFRAVKQPMRLFLSLDMGVNDGAVVYINNAPVASYNTPNYEDSSTTTVPATAPPFDPLDLVFEVDANTLKTEGAGDNNVITVELYSSADAGSTTGFDLRLEGSLEVENLLGWLPMGLDPGEIASTDSKGTPESPIVAVQGKNRHTIQGSSVLTLSDNYVIMRYRAKNTTNAAHVADGGWSKWTEPQLAEGWIKRVLAGINPFQQRVKDLFNHETNTSVSLVEQAGKRWEGNIALNLDNINDVGLIEIYETVLNRGKDLSINADINYGGANDALLLAAGYLSDLYMILGNEAYADAANSTIAFNTNEALAQYGDVATSLFSFKGQLATVLDEELALLRGRDDTLLPGTQKTPIYNRLIWNYTRGIDSGEAIYALNYNIKDRIWDLSINPNNIGDLPADGIISAADAAISYPQGHGDAYGHYLTAITGYYGLLNNASFSWTPRIEAVLVLGTPVSVDYQDERKFAAAAASIARSASRTLELTYRQQFSAAEDAGWSDLHEAKGNTNTGRTRHWGTDDWASRGGQGALFHWVTANSLLPAVDPNPNHSGIQKIDRTTVPELAEIAAQAAAIQQTLDHADARLNPLGLAAGALPFDISPTEVDAGKTHYEQIYERATVALTNAVSAFNNAKGSTQFLRRQEDSLEDQRNAIAAQEQAFTNQLIELYGTPYTDDIGPGKTYKQDYSGPDLLNSMIVELPEIFQDHGESSEYELLLDPKFVDDNKTAFNDAVTFAAGATHTYTLSARAEVLKPSSWTGRRVSPGKMQTTISNLYLARQDLQTALSIYQDLELTIEQQISLYESLVNARKEIDEEGENVTKEIAALVAVKGAATIALQIGKNARESVKDVTESVVEGAPKAIGLANDPSFALRALALGSKALAVLSSNYALIPLQVAIDGAADAIERLNFNYQANLSDTAFGNENRQLLYGLHTTLKSLKANAGDIDASLRRLDQAQRDLYALQAKGDRIQQQRLAFRQHSAALIQGYRTRDFAFRAFRDEALERYNALFDLSARYTYMAARAYDYETGLLDVDGNASATGFYEKIVQARALGVVVDGQPQFSGASTGDPGLSGVLAELNGDWSVVQSRLGFNNPDRYSTTFSLRTEKERILPGADGDLAWKDVLAENKMSNILDDPDVKRYCMQVADPNGNAVPGIVIPFSSTIATGYNFFGRPLAGGDHTFSPSSFSTKIRSSGIALVGYVGMDSPTTTSGALADIGASSPSSPDSSFGDAEALSATPYIYLIPVGADSMRSPPLGDTSTIRTWNVEDQAIPLPFNIANSDYSSQPAWVSAASLSEPAFTLRKHQAFRAVPDGTNFQDSEGFTNSRLIGRSAWNSEWKIVIPGNTLLNDPNLGIETFLNTVKDIKLHLETYSYSGN